MIYLYKNPETGQIKEVVQGMNDKHVYNEDGIEWKRVYTSPQTAIDTKQDPFSSKQFVERTRDKKGTMGDIWDYSKELSEKRKDKAGYDKKQQQAAKKWSEERGGRKAPKVLFGDKG